MPPGRGEAGPISLKDARCSARRPHTSGRFRDINFWERFPSRSIQVVEGGTWDLLAHADLALAASGTVTVEAAILGTPMVTFYRVSSLSWWMGKRLVRVPFFSMVNLIAGRRVVPELIQNDMTAERLAGEALHLLDNPAAVQEMRAGLTEIRRELETARDPMETAVELIVSALDKELVHDR